MIQDPKNEVIISNDGATILDKMKLMHPTAKLLAKGIHPQTITEAFLSAAEKADEVLSSVAVPVNLENRDQLLQSATTSLNSKVVSQNADQLAPIAVDAVLKVIDPQTATNVDLNDIR